MTEPIQHDSRCPLYRYDRDSVTPSCTCGLAQRREIASLKQALLDQTGRYLDAVNEAHRHHSGVVERDKELATPLVRSF